MGKMLLGINNCFAVKRWPEPDRWANIISEELDIKNVQLSLDLLDPLLPRSAIDEQESLIRDATRDYGLMIETTFTGLNAYNQNMLSHPKEHMRLAAENWFTSAVWLTSQLKAWATGGHLGSMSVTDYQNQTRRDYMSTALIKAVKRLAQVSLEHGLKSLLWEPMPVNREPPSTINEALQILNSANTRSAVPIQLCIDVGHQCLINYDRKEDLDPYRWLELLGDQSPTLHLQQTDGQADRHWPFTSEYNRRGIIHPNKILEALEKSNAKRTLLYLEVIHPAEYPEEKILKDLRESAKYWKDYI